VATLVTGFVTVFKVSVVCSADSTSLDWTVAGSDGFSKADIG